MNKKRLLVIEDDFDLGDMLTTFFKAKDYEVLHAKSGSEGITLARAKFPNIILLDVMLPDMEGFDVCRVLRSNTLTKYIPITFLTQRDARADKVAGLQLGADDYVTKPFDIEELRLRVERSIERATRDHLHEPRTGLPMGQVIDTEFYQLDGNNWQTIEINIKGFSAFRELYGFIAADDVVYLAANVIHEALSKFGTADDFMGIKEDDTFVIFTRTKEFKALQETVEDNFSKKAESMYNFTDIQQGHVILKAGTEKEREEPIMHLQLSEYEPTH